MASSNSLSHYLITLSENGELQQLSSALQQPSIAEVALKIEGVLVSAQASVRQELNLERMIQAAARSGHADIVEILLRFGQQHNIAGDNGYY
jgi:hypothetical protein